MLDHDDAAGRTRCDRPLEDDAAGADCPDGGVPRVPVLSIVVAVPILVEVQEALGHDGRATVLATHREAERLGIRALVFRGEDPLCGCLTRGGKPSRDVLAVTNTSSNTVSVARTESASRTIGRAKSGFAWANPFPCGGRATIEPPPRLNGHGMGPSSMCAG